MARSRHDDPKVQAALQKLEERDRDRRIGNLRAVMAKPEGRELLDGFIQRLKGAGGFLWRGNSEVGFVTARYDAGLDLENEIRRFAPREYRQMVLERLEREELEAKAREAAGIQRNDEKDDHNDD